MEKPFIGLVRVVAAAILLAGVAQIVAKKLLVGGLAILAGVLVWACARRIVEHLGLHD
jgi:hypothetical protein